MKKIWSVIFIVSIFPLFAFAADVPVAFGDAIINLLGAYKAHAGIAAIIVAVVQLLKSDLVGGLLLKLNQKWIPFILLALTGIGGAAQSVVAGKSWWQGLIDGFITTGIAASIYEGVKSIKSST